MFKVHKFFKGLLEITKLYLVLFIIILWLCLLFVYLISISPVILNVALMIIILSVVFIDKRFNWKGRVIMLSITILQLVVYLYLDVIPILIIKDLFWFSLVLNLAFIWHVLILHWCFEISDYYKNDYGRFLFSRLSVISSLTMLYWILNWISFLINWIEFYYHWIFSSKAKRKKRK